MYCLLYLVIMLLIIFITKTINKKILKPNVMFTIIWCLFLIMSTLGLYDIHKPSEIVHIYAIISIIIFNIVYLLNNKIYFNEKKIITGKPNLNLIYIVNILIWIYISKYLIKSIDIINLYGFAALRAYAFDSSMGLATTAELLIIQWIIMPIITATILISMVYLVMNENAKLLTMISIIDVTFYTLLFGGRYLILKMAIYYIFSVIFIKEFALNEAKIIRSNVWVVLLMVIAALIVTNLRNWSEVSIIENFVVYFVGQFAFLDVLLNDNNINHGVLSGMGTWGFVVNWGLAFIALLFKIPYEGSDYIITQITAIPRYISPTQSYNAMTTMLYPFIIDFGFIGIIVGTSFLAFLFSSIENIAVKKMELFYICLYVYFIFIILNSVLLYDLLFPSTFTTILFLFLFINKKRFLNIYFIKHK